MKKTITFLLMILALTINAQSLILTEDTVINQDENYLTVRTNGFNLTVNGSLNVTSFIMLNKGNQETGGGVYATDDIIVGGNVYFFEDCGYIKSDTGVSVGQDITGCGAIYYCTFFNHGFTDDDVYFTQDCTLSIPEIKFDFEQATLLKRFNILGQPQGNRLSGVYIAQYKLNGVIRTRKELWKDGVLISN